MQCALHLVLPGQGMDELVQLHSHLELVSASPSSSSSFRF